MTDRAPPASPVSHEADYIRTVSRTGLERLKASSKLIDPHDQYVLRAHASRDQPVRTVPREQLSLPPDVARFVGVAEATVLQDILDEAWLLNEQFVGEPQLEAFVQINGTAEQRDLLDRGLTWARAYVQRRLARPSTRDRGCQYRRFLRLWSELLPFLDRLGEWEPEAGRFENSTVLGQYLGPTLDFIAWSFFQGTWAREVPWSADGWPSLPNQTNVDVKVFLECMELFGVYQWKKSRIFDRLLADFAQALASAGGPHSCDQDERNEIGRLAEDIAEMRPFLVRNFPRSKSVVALPGGWQGLFGWDTLDQIGRLSVARSQRELLEGEQAGVGRLALSIGADGMLRSDPCPWRSVASYEGSLPFSPLSIGRHVLSAVHERLFSFYDRIDVAGIVARWHNQGQPWEPDAQTIDAPSVSGAVETEIIAATIAVGQGEVREGRRSGRVSSSLRLSVLRSILERSFGCEARSSKGSEMVFHRPGGRHAFVARHVSNPLVPAVAIQHMLKKLGITVEAWVEATGNR